MHLPRRGKRTRIRSESFRRRVRGLARSQWEKRGRACRRASSNRAATASISRKCPGLHQVAAYPIGGGAERLAVENLRDVGGQEAPAVEALVDDGGLPADLCVKIAIERGQSTIGRVRHVDAGAFAAVI